MTKICIFGAGAIGGYLAFCLSKAGAKVSLIARGDHLQAIKKSGLQLIINQNKHKVNLVATDNPDELGAQDYVIISLKAHSIPLILDNITSLFSKNTTVVSAVNGIPWWYFYKANTNTFFDDKPFKSVDPFGSIWSVITPERALGCVVYPACEIIKPGVIEHFDGDRFSLGEPSGERSERLRLLSELLIKGGLKAPQKMNIRDEIWIKIWGNCSFNLVSALTGTTLDEIGKNMNSREIVYKLMQECKNIGEAIGIKFRLSIDDRINGATKIIGHKPSTRQDIENRKSLEIDPIFSALLELSKKLNINVPTLKLMTTLLKLKACKLGLYKESF